jgi:ABC-type branched-subunit amino acid transport system substrate-binding protein
MMLNSLSIPVSIISGLYFSTAICCAAESSIAATTESIDKTDVKESTSTAAEIGKRIYQDGVLPDGTTITAVTQDDVSLTGVKVICADCHRKSGFGSSEGGTSVPAITGSVLYQPRAEKRRELYGKRSIGPGARPAYDDEKLARAIREGIDPSGRKLSKLMPRYNISDSELTYLAAYLESIDSTPAPGVSETTIQFATIITPDVTAEQKNTMLTTLTTYINDLNAGTRREAKRAKFSPWHKTWHYGAYRKWQLHVWQLSGQPESWHTQLNEFYAKQPVFAVINGIGAEEWRPIHEFCKTAELPCVFPTTNLPVTAEQDFYTIYFSRGIALEAAAVAKHLSQLEKPVSILQIHNNSMESITAADTTMRHLHKHGITDIKSFDIATFEDYSSNQLKTIIATTNSTYIILWLNSKGIAKTETFLEQNKTIELMYISSTLLDGETGILPESLLNKTYLLSQTSPPNTWPTHLSRAKNWASARKLQISDDYVMANAYFAATITADAIKHLRANLIRDYFIERLEHMVENAVFHSVYPRLSLGPGQRFASKGCYIAGPLGDGPDSLLTANYEWVVP